MGILTSSGTGHIAQLKLVNKLGNLNSILKVPLNCLIVVDVSSSVFLSSSSHYHSGFFG